MTRKISVADLKKAVDEAYESLSSFSDGNVNLRNIGAEPGKFGIAVVLTDGTVITRGDTNVHTPVGAISAAPLMSLLFAQASPMEILKQAGAGACACGCQKQHKPKDLGACARGLRAFSQLQPVGDADSKYNLFANRVADMAGADPQFNDKIYEAVTKEYEESGLENKLAADDFYLFDDARIAIDMYNKSRALEVSVEQLAVMGATIAADGVNPVTHTEVFDGALAQNVAGYMAAMSPHKMRLPWLTVAGLPAVSSYGGAVMGALPGTFGIAAYAPEVNDKGVSMKAARAIVAVMTRLGLSAFSSARATFVG